MNSRGSTPSEEHERWNPLRAALHPGNAVETALQQYLESVEAGNSPTNFQWAVATWKDWLREEHGLTTLEVLEVIDCRRYARHLKQRVHDGDLKASTTTAYYVYARAFLTFCVGVELNAGAVRVLGKAREYRDHARILL